MDERKTYRSSPIIFLQAFIIGIFSGFFLRMPYRLITRNVFYLPYKWEIPLCTAVGLIFGGVFLLCTYTAVYIGGNEVTIVKRFRKHTYPIDAHLSIGEKNINVKGISFEKRWLIIRSQINNCKPKKYRLNAFSDAVCEKIINQLNLLHWQDTPLTVKNIIAESSWDGDEHFELDAEQIIKREWKSIRNNSLMWIGLTAVMAVLVMLLKLGEHDTYRYGQRWYKSIAYLLVSFVLVLEIPFEVIRTKRNAKRCLYELSFKGDHLMINDDHYMIPDIQLLTVTHESIESRSLYPVQRYITIRDHDGIHKYWVGSESSILREDYRSVVGILVSAFVNYPEKIKHITKRSLWNK